MTIYDLLRHLVSRADWSEGACGDIVAHQRVRAAMLLIDRLEELNVLGQVAIDVTEEVF